MEGVFFRTVLDMSPSLDRGELRAIRQRADELGLYLEAGLGNVNPYMTAENPELRRAGNGDILAGFRKMMECCAEIDCRELWSATASSKKIYFDRFAIDRFRTDVDWDEQLAAITRFLKKLAPIARNHGIHINLETHEEITSFELLRIIDAVGADTIGIVYDTVNCLQRIENPVRSTKRIAPYVRQTHIKDAALVRSPEGAWVQLRPCGHGVLDFEAILAPVLAANPQINLTIENEDAAESGERVPFRRLLEITDESWLAAHPDLTPIEYAEYLELINVHQAKIDAGAAKGPQPYGYAEAVSDIRISVAHLRAVLDRLAHPARPEAGGTQ